MRLADLRASFAVPAPAGIAAALLVLLIAMAMQFVDRPVKDWVADLDPGLIGIFRVVTEAGDSAWYLVPTAVGGLALLLLAWGERDRLRRAMAVQAAALAGFLFASVALSGLMTILLKSLIGRARPRVLDSSGFYGFEPWAWAESQFNSFPSGHSNTATAFALAVGLLWPRLLWPMLVLAVPVAGSRVFVNAHYASDVVAGAALAVATTLWLRRVLAARRVLFETAPDGRILRRHFPWRRAFRRSARRSDAPAA